MKALRKALRHTEEVFSDNETQSSQGSEKAPSEDNLDPEEIATVLPIEDDPELMRKLKKKEESLIDKSLMKQRTMQGVAFKSTKTPIHRSKTKPVDMKNFEQIDGDSVDAKESV
jgi:hypothetical protein